MSQAQPKKLVLIVDDSEIDRSILESILQDEYDLLTANDGQEAMEILQQRGADISAVLLDVFMPVMNGYDVLKDLHVKQGVFDSPILVMSQESGAEYELKALELGAADFVTKPYRPGVLRYRLSKAIQMHEASKKIYVLQRDELTGLYTKAAFAERVGEVLEERRDVEWNMIALDIDRFKLVNETYGQRIGDELLAYLGKLFLEFADATSCICGRSYADHFFMLVERKDYHYIKGRYTQMSDYLAQFPLDMKVALKMGVYEIYNRDVPVDSMCDRAMIATNQVKGQYMRDIAFYDDSLRKQLLLEQHIADDMKQALEEEQFQVYFQPKYDIFSETLSGAEALVRWIHPQNGFMSPAEFIPVFERNGFITEVDMYVWDKTCEFIRKWLDMYNCYVPISVNVSRKDIYKPNLPQILIDTVHRHGLEPRHLHLEITESAYVENPSQLLQVVAELKKAGFSIEMDDFGSGYSSLNMLASMPIDILKLDMNFVKNYSEENNSRGIMSFVIGLAKWMNLYVIAEGVETHEQLELLRGMDCNLAQGYYFSKPLPAGEFKTLLQKFGKNLENPEDQELRLSTNHEGEFDTLLIVDGLAISRAILSDYLGAAYSIVEASGGKAALQYLKHVKRPDLILMEAHLPDMNADELLREIKKDPLMEHIPVIVLTHGSDNTVDKVLAAGADTYLLKPYTKKDVCECVERVMSAKREHFQAQDSEIVDKMRMLNMLSTKDYLTGLWNRAALGNRVEEQIKYSPNSACYVVSIDIDDYRGMVDTYGYAVGDKALHCVADRLRNHFRNKNAVGRISGDQFGVFVNEELTNEELLVRMAHLQTVLEFCIGEVRVTCSCGVSKYPECGTTFAELYQQAQDAVEQAKKSGRNSFCVCEACRNAD